MSEQDKQSAPAPSASLSQAPPQTGAASPPPDPGTATLVVVEPWTSGFRYGDGKGDVVTDEPTEVPADQADAIVKSGRDCGVKIKKVN